MIQVRGVDLIKYLKQLEHPQKVPRIFWTGIFWAVLFSLPLWGLIALVIFGWK